MAKITGSLLISARDGSGWESASGGPAGAGEAVRGAWYGVASSAPQASGAPHQPSTTHHAVISQHPVHQRAQEDHDADNAIGGEERRIEPRQVSRLHQVMLPCDQRR